MEGRHRHHPLAREAREGETKPAPVEVPNVAYGSELSSIAEGARLNPYQFMGKVRILTASFAPSATVAAGTVVLIARLPAGAVLLPPMTLVGSGGSFDLGTYQRVPEGGAVFEVEPQRFGANVNPSNAEQQITGDPAQFLVPMEDDLFLGVKLAGDYNPGDGLKLATLFVLD